MKKKIRLPLMIFILLSFVVLPAIAFPLLIYINQIERFSFILCGYLGMATQIVSLSLKETRIWRLHMFDYEDKNEVGKWINILILLLSAMILCYGVYFLFWGWETSIGLSEGCGLPLPLSPAILKKI